jgi:hypothetical protein
VIDVGGDCWHERHWFGSERIAARFYAPWIMPLEDGIPISVCTDPRITLTGVWPSLKDYI